MKRLRRIISIALLSFSTMSYVSTFALTPIVGYHSINNSSEGTYKTDKSILQSIIDKIGSSSNFNEIINYSEDKSFVSNNTIIAYLIENDILTEDLKIKDENLYNTSTFSKIDYEDSDTLVSRSDFLVALTKAVYGVQESRPLVYKTSASRVIENKRISLMMNNNYIPNDYNDSDYKEGDNLDFSKGDYAVYVTPNVYELYFKTLVDKGILSLSEFSNISFVDDMNSYGKVFDGVKRLPIWSNELGLYRVGSSNSSSVEVYGDNPLGQAFKYEDGDISNNESSWLFKEDLLTIDALKYIESLLRLTEKDMTDTEANLINYKYGVNYINNIPDEDKSTISFLVAKGILNFEDGSDFENIYKNLNMGFFLKLIYRVDNPNARLDFSTIQLTDNDNYWLSKGFSSGSLKFVQTKNVPETKTVVTELKQDSNNSFFKERVVTIASGEKEYKVERTFYSGVDYYYKGVKITKGMDKKDEISKVEEVENVGKVIGIKVTFTVKATSPQAAVAILDTNTYSKSGDTVDLGTLPTINKVTSGKTEVTYLSQDALSKLSGTPIKVIEDKYLMNTETGARALLLEDNKIAIVGNEIIRTSDNIVFGLNGEVHYNFEIISKLLSETMINELDPNSVYKNLSTDIKYNLYPASGDDSIGTAYVQNFTVNAPGNGSSVKDYFYNITQNNAFSNYLIKDIGKDLGVKSSVYMAVEFEYVVSKNMSDSFGSFDANRFLNNALTIKEVMNWIYTKPSAVTLSNWWEENMSFNNSLINYMMGSKNLNFMKSGYLTPKITFLPMESDVLDGDKLNRFFKDTVKLSPALLNNYNNGFVQSFFNFNGVNKPTNSFAIDNLKMSRTLNYSNPHERKDKQRYTTFDNFAVSASGQIYRQISSDTKYTADHNKNTIRKNKREVIQEGAYSVGSVYTISHPNGNTYTYVCTEIDDKGKVTLVNTKGIDAKFDGDKLVTNWDSSYSMIDYINDLNKGFTENCSVWKKESSAMGDPGNVYYPKNISYYVAGTYKAYDSSSKKFKAVNSKTTFGKKTLKKLSKIKVYPVLRFSSLEMTPTVDNKIINEPNYPYLDMGNISNVGLSAQIIDSIVQANSEYVSMSGIPADATVVIGDISFKKVGSALVSPLLSIPNLTSKYSATDLGNGTDSDPDVVSLVADTLGTLNVTLINNGIFDGGDLLSSYLTYSAIGSGADSTDYNNSLVRVNNQLVVRNGKSDKTAYSPGSNFSNYSISIKLDNAIKFRPLGTDNSVYTLVTTVNKGADGYINNLNYFRETLSYSDLELMQGDLSKSKFSASENSEALMQKFRDLFSIKAERDFLGLLRYWVRVLCTWLTFINLLIAYVKSTVLDVVIRDIRYPSTSDRNGIDIYKILTLGFQDVDTKIGPLKAVGLSFMFFAIMVFVSV